VSFAVHWIKAEIHEYVLRNWRLVKMATTKAQRKLFFNLRSMKQGSWAGLSAGGTWRKWPKTLKRQRARDVREMETRLYGQDMALEPGIDDEEDAFAPIAYLAAPDAEPTRHLEIAERERMAGEGLGRALATLDPRSRHIVESRWLDDENPATLHELAAVYGISAERVRQIEAKALQKLKGALVA
jgi:RNA polymerase sigma-32 factor